MSAIEFEPWPKIARLNRDIIITEKIDGTNAAVLIVPFSEADHIAHEHGLVELFETDQRNLTALVPYDDETGREAHLVFAQSRTRFITPGNDNFGFARWVQGNAEKLVATLGPGRHFGEWWGSGIQRGYGLQKGEKRFSLFNSSRWSTEDFADSGIAGLGVVPTLYEGPFSEELIQNALEGLRWYGSYAEPGFMRPEGIIIWHTAERTSFKVTLKGDEAPKSLAAAA